MDLPLVDNVNVVSLLALCVAAKLDSIGGRREAALGEDETMYSAPLEIAKAHISCKNRLRKQSRSVMVVIELGSWMSVIVPMRSGRAHNLMR